MKFLVVLLVGLMLIDFVASAPLETYHNIVKRQSLYNPSGPRGWSNTVDGWMGGGKDWWGRGTIHGLWHTAAGIYNPRNGWFNSGEFDRAGTQFGRDWGK